MKHYNFLKSRLLFICLLLLPACAFFNPASANDQEGDKAADDNDIVIIPSADFYPYYLADPRSARTVIQLVAVPDNGIEDTSDMRINHSLGRRFGLLRFGDETAFEAWQLDLEVGYFTNFDANDQTDNIGWDGLYGLFLSRRLSTDLFVRFGTLHDSSHLGDEYIEETGRERIDYTREELIAGTTWLPTPAIKLYTELGWAWDVKSDMEALRWQFGVEYYGRENDLYLGLPWYVATDLNLFEERDWEPAINLQLGLIYAPGQATERFRLVLEAYSGRSVMGEFSFEDESHLSIGLHYDY